MDQRLEYLLQKGLECAFRMYVFLDESGDLGFDFSKTGTSDYFVVTILVVFDSTNMKQLDKAVEKTIKNKILRKRKRKDKHRVELKGSRTDIKVKSYFFTNAGKADFSIYSIALNKKRVFPNLQNNRDKLYNFVAKQVIEKIPFNKAMGSIALTIDKSKKRREILDFNRYVERELVFIRPSHTPLNIYHIPSHENKGVQAADMFSWGIFRKYELEDYECYDMFKYKIQFETEYLPQ